MKTRWFFLFFFVSGFCSLVYEVVWLRLSMAKFGVTTPMVSIVLSVFMAGLGLGSWLGGRFVRRFAASSAATPLRLYGATELLIGLSGLCVPFLIDLGYGFIRDAGRNLTWGSSIYYVISGGWMTLALLPWCTCMGATFPLAMAAIRRINQKESQRSFSYLYLANVLGAILGATVPAFVLIELYGFRGTLYVASVLNALLALTVFALASRLPAAAAPSAGTAARSAGVSSRLIGWQLFATGLCSMAMEVVWTRQFAVYLGNVVYAFAAILAIYLGATFLGSSLYRRWSVRKPGGEVNLAWGILGVISLLPLLFADPRLPGPPITEIGQAYFGLGALRVALGIAPFSALVGFLTPMLVDRWSAGDPERAGSAYAVNVLGSILGPVIAGFAVLPWAGERAGLVLVALPLFAIGLAVGSGLSRGRIAVAASAVLSVVLFQFTQDYGSRYPQRLELRDYTANVIAFGTGLEKHLLVNGMGMTVLTPITKVMAHLPLTWLGRKPENGLAICFGMGTSFRSLLSWDIDTTAVELVPSVPKLFSFYHPNGAELLRQPNAHVVIDDGRRFLERSNQQFDVIVVDPPPPTSAPTSGLLYSEQFYTVIKPHMKPDGILQMWFPDGDDATTAAVAKSIRSSFPYVRAFASLTGYGTHFLCRLQPFPEVNGELLSKRLPAKAAADLTEWDHDYSAAEMFDDTLEGEKTFASLIGLKPSIPPITDDRPINEYFFLRSRTLQPK